METKIIPFNEINSDLGVVNAARVSLANRHEEFDVSRDTKLLVYLATHNHFTPFCHGRLYFQLQNFDVYEREYFYSHANQAGLSLVQIEPSYWFKGEIDQSYWLKGSLYGLAKNLHAFRDTYRRDFISDTLHSQYPVSAHVLTNTGYPSFVGRPRTYWYVEPVIAQYATDNPLFYKILTATLYVKVPIFVARQVRTSQVGFMYSDQYVEGESFVFNEVSRRYVNNEPEFYKIEQWRVRKGKSVKQGSTGIADETLQNAFNQEQTKLLAASKVMYLDSKNSHIAPEQARALLPQSMYTEFYMTGTLHRWAQFCQLRLQVDVQEETQIITRMIKDQLSEKYPTWTKHYQLD